MVIRIHLAPYLCPENELMKEVPYIIKRIEDWPITKFYRVRDRMVNKLAEQTIEHILSSPQLDLAGMINQTIYAEKLRAKMDVYKVDPPEEFQYWKKLEDEMSEGIREEVDQHLLHRDLLRRIIYRYSEEIHGDFKPKTFRFARNMLSGIFRFIYNPFKSVKQGAFWGKREDLLDRFRIEGPINHIQALFDKGTVLVLPTHFSNLDSILVGFGIEMLTGMPAFSYGAGLNLYDYELLAYYMSKLGAYKIDRRKKNAIYLQTLKQFSVLSIQEGMNSIFFPGGTRSRSGHIEDTLKLGILSTLVDSQNEFYLRNFNKKIIIVPLVISYHFTFEGRSLIDQHLRIQGKENYISKYKRKNTRFQNLRFIKRILKSGSNVTLSFGQPLDIFGNKLDREGRSTKNQEIVDISEHFMIDGQITIDRQRNGVYTRYLADAIVDSFKRENVVLTSHLIAFVAYRMFTKRFPNMDFFARLTLPNEYFKFSVIETSEVVHVLLEELKRLSAQGQLKLSPELKVLNAQEVLRDGIRQLNTYHFYSPLNIRDEFLYSDDFRLLFYYHNRLDCYALEDLIQVKDVKSLKISKTLYNP